jgi:hypothetical protein
MKKNFILCLAMLLGGSIPLLAQQSPLVGTWKMISGKVTGPEGQKEAFDTLTYKETKIITPTHYMLISFSVRGDSVRFQRSLGGTIRITGNKFVEYPTVASDPAELKIITDFTWKVEGDKMIQKGPVYFPDGKKVMMDELVFKRVASTKKTVANSK